jgi:hypothetical protein
VRFLTPKVDILKRLEIFEETFKSKINISKVQTKDTHHEHNIMYM